MRFPHWWALRPHLPGMLRAWALTTPAAVAFIDDAGELTWAGLDARVTRAARGILGLPGGDVAVCCHTGRAAWTATLAGLRAGRRVRLLSPRSGRLTVEAAAAGAPVVVDRPLGLPDEVEITSLRPAPGRIPHRPGGLVMHSKGTGGRPHAVDRSRQQLSLALQSLALLRRLPLAGSARLATLAPLDHGHGVSIASAALLLGKPLIDATGTDDPAGLLRRTRADLLSGVPAQLAALLDGDVGGLAVRTVIAGSDVLSPALVAALSSRLDADVWDCYGSTELGTVCVAGPADLGAAPGTVGRPIDGVRVRVVDAAGRALPRGTEGLIEVRSPMGGRPRALDRGWLDAEGRLFVSGRADGAHVTGGETVDDDALRAWLAAHGHASARVERRADARFGSRPVVWFPPGAAVDAERLRARIRADLGPALTPATVLNGRAGEPGR